MGEQKLPLIITTDPNLNLFNFSTPSGLTTPIAIKVGVQAGDIKDYLDNASEVELKFFKENSRVSGSWINMPDPYDSFTFTDTDTDSTGYFLSSRDASVATILRLPTADFSEGNYKLTASVFRTNNNIVQHFETSFTFAVSNDIQTPDIYDFSIEPTNGFVPLTVTLKPTGDQTHFVDPDVNPSISWLYRNTENDFWAPMAAGNIVDYGNYPNETFGYQFTSVGNYEIKMRIIVSSGSNSETFEVVYPVNIQVQELSELDCDFEVYPTPPYIPTQTLLFSPVLKNGYPSDKVASVTWYDSFNYPTGTTEYTITDNYKTKFPMAGNYTIGLKVVGANGQSVKKYKEIVVYPGAEKNRLKIYMDILPEYREMFPLDPFPKMKFKCKGFYYITGDDDNTATEPDLYQYSEKFFVIQIDDSVQLVYDSTYEAMQMANLDSIKDYTHETDYRISVYHTYGNDVKIFRFQVYGVIGKTAFDKSIYFYAKGNPYFNGKDSSGGYCISDGDTVIIDTLKECPTQSDNQGGIYRATQVAHYHFISGTLKQVVEYIRPIMYTEQDAISYVDGTFYSNSAYDIWKNDGDLFEDGEKTSDLVTGVSYAQDTFTGWFWHDGVNLDGTSEEINCKIVFVAQNMLVSKVEVNGYNVSSTVVPFYNGSVVGVPDNNGFYTYEYPVFVKVQTGWNKIIVSIGTGKLSDTIFAESPKVPKFTIYYKNENEAGNGTVISGKKPTSTSVTSEMEQNSLGVGSNGSIDSLYRDKLYETITAAQSLTSLYFAPRNWDEAGKVLSISKENRQGKPVIAIEIPKRVSKYYDGVEGFRLHDLPILTDMGAKASKSPTGCIFATPQQDDAEVIRISSAKNITFKDLDWGVNVTKEGLMNHPIILFAQNSDSYKVNAFGALNEAKTPFIPLNEVFTKEPHKPYLTLLRKDEYLSQADGDYKFFALTYDSTKNKGKLEYQPSHIDYTIPFDLNCLKFRNRQDIETKTYSNLDGEITGDDIFTKCRPFNLTPQEPLQYAEWGRGDVLSKTYTGTSYNLKNMPSWSLNDTSWSSLTGILTYEQAGSLYLDATEKPTPINTNRDLNIYTSYILAIDETNVGLHKFYGTPYNLGVYQDSSEYVKTSFFKSMHNIFSNYGKASSLTDSNSYTINDYQMHGFVGDASVGVNSRLDLRSKNLTNGQTDIIKPISNNNRYIVYSKYNNVFLYDQYTLMDFGPYGFFGTNALGQEYILNIQPIGKTKLRYMDIIPTNAVGNSNFINQIRINQSKQNYIANLPYSSKYFGGSTMSINTDEIESSTKWQVLGGKLGNYYSKDEQEIIDTRTVDFGVGVDLGISSNPDRIISSNICENSIYFTTETSAGIAALGEHSYYYSVDEATGNIIELYDGNFGLSIEGFTSAIDDKTYLVKLNPENCRQNITIKGDYDGMQFNASSSIVLADYVKPIINNNIDKVLIPKGSISVPISVKITTKDWMPDKIIVCPTQLKTDDDYLSYFSKASSQNNIVTKTNYGNYEIGFDYDVCNGYYNGVKFDISNVAGSHTLTVGLENYPSSLQKSDTFSANYKQNGKYELWSNFGNQMIFVPESNISVSSAVENQRENLVKVSTSIKCWGIKLTSNNMNYDSNLLSTIISHSLPLSLPVIQPLETDNTNRLAGCTLVTKRNGRIQRYTISSSNDTEIVIAGDLSKMLLEDTNSEFVLGFIAPFFPEKAALYDSMAIPYDRGAFAMLTYNENQSSVYQNNVLLLTETGSEIWLTLSSILYKVITSQIFYVDYYDNPSDFIYTSRQIVKIVSNSQGSSIVSSASTYAEIIVYSNYDEQTQVFSNPFVLGAGANDFSFFNFGKYVDGSSFYVKIKFSRQVLYSSLSFNIYGYNDTTQEFEAIFNSPYTQSSDDLNYIGGNITIDSETSYVYADTFVVSVNQMPIFESGQEANVWKEIRFKLKATDIPGNTIEIGEI